MSPFAIQNQKEGVTVVGEAFRRVPPENAEFLIEITAGGTTAAHALRDCQSKTTQLAQMLGGLGVQANDIQTISLNVMSQWSPLQALPGPAAMPQLGQPGFEPQFGSYHARNILRVTVRQAARVGEVLDAATRAGVTVSGSLTFQASDEAAARRTVLEAAGRDARSKAETLATAAGKQVGDAIALSEDCIVSNGTYSTLRSMMPLAIGPGSPQVAGELEYYARVSATFRLQ
jgi:uncharacterized protein YggE